MLKEILLVFLFSQSLLIFSNAQNDDEFDPNTFPEFESIVWVFERDENRFFEKLTEDNWALVQNDEIILDLTVISRDGEDETDLNVVLGSDFGLFFQLIGDRAFRGLSEDDISTPIGNGEWQFEFNEEFDNDSGEDLDQEQTTQQPDYEDFNVVIERANDETDRIDLDLGQIFEQPEQPIFIPDYGPPDEPIGQPGVQPLPLPFPEPGEPGEPEVPEVQPLPFPEPPVEPGEPGEPGESPVERVGSLVEAIIDPNVEPEEPVIDPAVEAVEPVIDPAVEAVEPVIDPNVEPEEPVIDAAVESLEAVIDAEVEAVEPVVDPEVEAVEAVIDPAVETVDPVEVSDVVPDAIEIPSDEVIVPDEAITIDFDEAIADSISQDLAQELFIQDIAPELSIK